MKDLFKNIILRVLILLAKVRVNRLRPFVIGITGSIGKTSTKEAIYTILKSKYQVLRSEKSFNTDFGLPLAILEQDSGFSSAVKWSGILLRAFWNAFFGGRNIQIIVLEMGVDKPGDMDKLLKIIKPQVGILTNISPVHLAEGQFKDLDDIFLEKKKLVETLPEKGIAILNADDPYISRLADSLNCRKLFYGTSEAAELRATDIKQKVDGISFNLQYNSEETSISLPLIGSFNIYILLPAIAAAISQGYTLNEAAAAIQDYKSPPGRMNLIEGVKNSIIIDSSYNASPVAVKKALDILSGFEGRRIAVIGNMNELGDYSEIKHKEIGAYAANKADVIITVGEMAKWIQDEAIYCGVDPQFCFHFDDAISAATFLHKNILAGDIILVKGSQNNVRLERLVKKIMKDPDKAPLLLARQNPEWEHII
jgi:UDP-N-acetylmuramoyl-tripeptide--D-alanyl-D-alanine ligase